MAARALAEPLSKRAGPAGGHRKQAGRLGQHRGRPGGQGHRRPHAGRRHQRQPDLGQAAVPQAALRPGARTSPTFRCWPPRRWCWWRRQRAAAGAAFFDAARQGGEQVELRLGRHRLGGPPGHGAAPEPACPASRPSTCPTRATRRWSPPMIGGQIQMALIPPGVAHAADQGRQGQGDRPRPADAARWCPTCRRWPTRACTTSTSKCGPR